MSAADAEWIAGLRAALAAAGDPQRAASQQRYMKSAMPYHGITSPEVRALVRPHLELAAAQLTDRSAWEKTIRALWDGATHREERYAALALARARRFRRWQDPATLTLYRHLVLTGAWWDVVDEIAGHLVGPIVTAHRSTEAQRMMAWAEDDHLWLRRTAILHQLGCKDDTDSELLAATIEPNLATSRFGDQFWIRKAIGWALRQYSYTDPIWVRGFVDRQRQRMASLTVREATKRLPPVN